MQRYLQAKPAPGMAQPAWWVLGELGARLVRGAAPASAAEVFDRLAATVPAFAGLSYAGLELGGRNVNVDAAAAPSRGFSRARGTV